MWHSTKARTRTSEVKERLSLIFVTLPPFSIENVYHKKQRKY